MNSGVSIGPLLLLAQWTPFLSDAFSCLVRRFTGIMFSVSMYIGSSNVKQGGVQFIVSGDCFLHSMIEFGCSFARSVAVVRRSAARLQLPISQRIVLLQKILVHYN